MSSAIDWQQWTPADGVPRMKPMRNWKEIAEEASRELDGKRLMELTDELLAALDEPSPS